VGSLLDELTVRSEGLDANACIGVGVEVGDNVSEMIGFPQIIIVENSDESAAADSIP